MSQEAVVTPRKHRRRRATLIGIGVLLLVALIIAAKLNAPSHGTIVAHPQPIAKKTVTTPQASQPISQSNSYYSLSLPAGFNALGGGVTPSGVLYTQSLTKNISLGHLVIAIAIKPTPDGGLTSDSSYKLRTSQPARFHMSTQSVQGESVTIANDSESSAVVAFWPHASTFATISLTLGFEGPPADNNSDELATLQTIMNAWQWQ